MDKKIPLHYAILGLFGIAGLFVCIIMILLTVPKVRESNVQAQQKQIEARATFEAMSYGQVITARKQYSVQLVSEDSQLCDNAVPGKYYCQDLTIKITNNSDVALPLLTMMVYRDVSGYGPFKHRYTHRFNSPLMPGESRTMSVETETNLNALVNYDRLWVEIEPNINKVVRHLYPELTGKY